MKWILIYLAVLNGIAFALYGIDKRKAIRHRYRISESMLIWAAVLGGSAGAFLGMMVFHHKTKKRKFRYGIPVIMAVQAALGVYISWKGIGFPG